MALWSVSPITEEPEMTLSRWKVYLVQANFSGAGDTIHFVGDTNYYRTEARVTSPINNFDKNAKKGISRSGRVYRLVGKSTSLSTDAKYVWANWLAKNGNPDYIDFSDQF